MFPVFLLLQALSYICLPVAIREAPEEKERKQVDLSKHRANGAVDQAEGVFEKEESAKRNNPDDPSINCSLA
jgi:hypothetical protein